MKVYHQQFMQAIRASLVLGISLLVASCGITNQSAVKTKAQVDASLTPVTESPAPAIAMPTVASNCNPSFKDLSATEHTTKANSTQDQTSTSNSNSSNLSVPVPTQLDTFIQAYIQKNDLDPTETRYEVTPLNLTAHTQAYKVVLIGSYWCGTGGCDHLIVVPNQAKATKTSHDQAIVSSCVLGKAKLSSEFKIINDWQPIQDLEVLPGMRNGWHKLKLVLGGGGSAPAYRIYAYSPIAHKYVLIQAIN